MEHSCLKIHGETAIQTEDEEITDTGNISLFNTADAKELATNSRLGKIKELFSKFKMFVKSKTKGEDKENDDQSR